MFPLNLYARVRISLSIKCTRDRGCSAHPVFPAPSLEGRVRPLFLGRSYFENLGRMPSRERERISSRRPRERGDPYAVSSMFVQSAHGLVLRFNSNARGYGSPRPVRNCALGGDDKREF